MPLNRATATSEVLGDDAVGGNSGVSRKTEDQHIKDDRDNPGRNLTDERGNADLTAVEQSAEGRQDRFQADRTLF